MIMMERGRDAALIISVKVAERSVISPSCMILSQRGGTKTHIKVKTDSDNKKHEVFMLLLTDELAC